MRPTSLPFALFASLVCAPLALAGCPAANDVGQFGDAKPTKDDGTIGKKQELPPAPPDFANAVAITPSFDKATNKLTVTLNLKPGYHAYAPGESIGQPVTLAVGNGWTLDGTVAIPEGKKKDLGELGTSVILEGDVPLTATVRGGSGDVTGEVTAQVCTDRACDRPKKHPFTVPTT